MVKQIRTERRDARRSEDARLPGASTYGEHSAYSATPIPPRASAFPAHIARARSRYPRTSVLTEDEDVTRIPTVPQPAAWQKEHHLVAEDTMPTSPARAVAIDELDTRPPGGSYLQSEGPDRLQSVNRQEYDLTEIDTLPPAPIAPRVTRRLGAEAMGEDERAIDLAPVDISTKRMPSPSPFAQSSIRTSVPLSQSVSSGAARARAVERSQQRHAVPFVFRPLDNLRWWLLAPGRLEFLIWLGGTILLLCFTGGFVLVVAMSLGAFNTAHQNQNTIPPLSARDIRPTPCDTKTSPGAGNGKSCISITASSPFGFKVTLLDGDLIVVGASLRLHGQGFSARELVAFTHDANMPCKPAAVQADQQGEFSVTLKLADGSGWQPGRHLLVIADSASHHAITLSLMLVATPATPGVTVTPTATTPTPVPPVVATVVQFPGTGPGSVTTPVISNSPVPPPAPIAPTAAPAPPVPTAKPAPAPTPGPTPTPADSPTPTATAEPQPTATQDGAPTPNAISNSQSAAPAVNTNARESDSAAPSSVIPSASQSATPAANVDGATPASVQN